MIDDFIDDVKRWAKKPYDDDMDLLSWFLFVGIWICAAVLWSRVIARFR